MTLLELALSHQGKDYLEGWQDCYTAIQNLYKDYCDLILTDYARPHLWYMNPEMQFMDKLYTVEGFEQISSNPSNIKVGDLLIMQMGRTDTGNHLAVYVGGNKIYHHLTNLKSAVSEYDNKWRTRVSKVIRHDKVTRKIEGRPLPVIPKIPYATRVKLAGGEP